MITEEEQQQEAQYLSASFKIDEEGLADRGRSLGILLLHRRCASCWGTLVQKPRQGLDIKASEHLKQIARHCSAEPDFIHPDLPVL